MGPLRKLALRVAAVLAVAILATGCIQMQDQLTIAKDGSGSWKYKMVLNPQLTAMMAQAEAEDDANIKMGDDDDMPPADRKALEEMVGKAKGAKVTSFTREVKDGSTIIVANVSFTSIEAVMDSELGEMINWYFYKDGNDLVATTKPLMDEEDDDNEGGIQLGNEFQMAKGMMQGLRVNRRLSLPAAPTKHNAHGVKGNLAAWDFRMTPETTEAQFKKASNTNPEYRTSAAGIAFKLPLGTKPGVKKPVKELGIDTQEVVAGDVGIKPMNATLTRRTSYDEENKMHFGDTPLQIQFKVPHPNPRELMGYTGPFVTEATDNVGTDINPKKQGFHDPEDLRDIHIASFEKNPKDFNLNIQLKSPDRTATTYSVTGHLFLHSPGATKTVNLNDLGKHVGKQIPNEGDLWIKLESLEDDNVGLKFKGDWVESIRSIEAFDKAGKKLKQNSSSRSRFNNQAHHNYGYEGGLPDRMVIKVATSVKKEKVPFSFKDLKLP